MDNLDEIARRSARLQERFVSAVTFSGAAATSALLVPAERSFMLLVAVGAVAWAAIEVIRLWLVGGDRVAALDRLVLAGSSDPRCEQRRSQLRSPLVHHRLAQMLRQTCQQSHRETTGTISLWLLNRRAVHAVEDDLEDLAEVFDKDAGRLSPEAVVRARMLIAPRSSPLYAVTYMDAVSSTRAVRDAQLMIAHCRAELRISAHDEVSDVTLAAVQASPSTASPSVGSASAGGGDADRGAEKPAPSARP